MCPTTNLIQYAILVCSFRIIDYFDFSDPWNNDFCGPQALAAYDIINLTPLIHDD